MSPPSYTKITLDFPPMSADFDPYNRGYLVVGGGGGEGRSGVSNKIALLDITSPATIEKSAEIELSRDEDSVTCLANLASKDGLITFAGINSSEKDRLAGRNEHFRSFMVDYPPKKATGTEPQATTEKTPEGKITFHGKTSLFKPPKEAAARKEAYQRVLRLSPTKKSSSGSKRIGAAASSFSAPNEVVIFDATSSAPSSSDIIEHIELPENAEANDIDFIEQGDGYFLVGYVTDDAVRTLPVSYDFASHERKTPSIDPRTIYTVPFPDVFEKPGRSKLRALRFLTPNHVLLLSNLPNRKGAELSILRLYQSGGPGTVMLRKRLPSHVKAAIGMDVSLLDADPSTGERQIVVAVAGQDISVCVYTLDYRGSAKDSISHFHKVTVLKDVHPLQITQIKLSPFHSPWPSSNPGGPPTPADLNSAKPPGPQHLRLCTTSLGNTVVVDTFTLRPLHPSKRGTRYILPSASVSDRLHTGLSLLTIGFVLVVTLLLLQGVLGYNSTGSSALNILPPRLRDALQRLGSYSPPGAVPPHLRHRVQDAVPEAIAEPIRKTSQRLRDILHLAQPGEGADTKAIIVREGDSATGSTDLSTEVHADTAQLLREHVQAKRWEELSKSERERWKERLVEAGHWAVEEGETVLKGIFFSSYAGFVGQVVGQALGG
ncbi:hypothetical protein W97_05881 [Coniosporium apollinis CBS 100218]|uniref:Guanine nucleotide-exchange factor SEC12 n=1 Tax=Coniosporium apollinis (strain CBS 100218) TaxID=1168221 RepID=R7YXI7_CONA1|nr:uncharacterized protein W97_05881 [Coniosporium apollinis CBS 100218]EON66635.1 hypothetical protein W97_05881 [Coniosporium apollinis CBS 100218]